jgi:hypothetical protein
MYKTFLIILSLTSQLTLLSAQEEAFFNELNVDKSEIKISKQISGLIVDFDFVRLLPGTYMGLKAGSVETQISYFHENRIANTWSLFKSVGFGNSVFNRIEVIDDPNHGYQPTTIYRYQYELTLNMRIEPRWYFSYKNRHVHQKKIINNTGWYLSLPLSVKTMLLHEPVNNLRKSWLPDGLNVNITAVPTIGYRNSFENRWLFEVNLGYIPYHIDFNGKQFFTNSARRIGYLSADSFNSEVKIAFTF